MKLKIVTIITFLIYANIAILLASNDTFSLNHRIKNAGNDKKKVTLMLKLADSLSTISPDKALQIYDSALVLAKKIGFKYGIAESHYSRGYLFISINEFKLAEKSFQDCIRFVNLNSEKGRSCLKFLGYIHTATGDFNSAIADYTQLLKVGKETSLTNMEISEIYTSLGNTYLLQEKFYSAQEMYLRSLEYARKIHDKGLIADCYVNIGIVESHIGMYDKAKQSSIKALKINERNNDINRIANNLNNLSKIYNKNGQNDSALIFLFRTLDVIKSIDDKEYSNDIKKIEANTYAELSLIYLLKKKYDTALTMAFEAKKKNLAINYLAGYYWDLLNIAQIYIDTKKNLDTAKLYIDLTYNAVKGSDLLSLINHCYKTSINYFYYSKNMDSMQYFWEKFSGLQEILYKENINNLNISLEDKFDMERKLNEHKIMEIEKNRKQWIIIISLIAGTFALLVVAFVTLWERRKSEKLLLNILPKAIAKRLKSREKSIADSFDSASIVFIDIAQFTEISKDATPERIVAVLNQIYTEFDHIAEKHGLEKIKTIGDCYMAASGVPQPREDHAEAAANFAIEAMGKLNGYITGDGTLIQFRCGIDCGPIVAGVIGEKKFIYDLWGDTVNTASRMEEYGESGKIHCTERYFSKLINDNSEWKSKFMERGSIRVKGIGMMKTYFLVNSEK